MKQETDGFAIASLVLSILTFILGPLGCVPGIICGHIARARIRKNPELSGAGLAQAGLIVGYLFLAFLVLCVFLFMQIWVVGPASH
ncbi:MAG: DUF4190 domain-containing protein [Chthoniobacteraceae bacterium]|nr:DUF4190 domain-containing protein [Chthoniobacteraceae bacterium]